jgi:PAS domain S-box-containing protein
MRTAITDGPGIEVASAHREGHAGQESRPESHLIVDGIPGLVAYIGPTGDVEFVNSKVLQYCGRTLSDLQQWRRNDIVHPEDLPRVVDLFTRSIASGSPFDIVQRLRRFDGAYRWFRNEGAPLRDEAGRVVRWCVLLTDIDSQKRGEDAVRESEHRLKLIIDTIPALAWSARPDGGAEFFNQHYLDFVGLSLAQAKDWGWSEAVHPDDLSGLVATWRRIMDSGQPGEAEARLRRYDGVYRWFLMRASPLRDENGSITQWYGVNTDVEDRKIAEAKVRQACDHMTEAQRLSRTGSFTLDLRTQEQTWSDELYRICGFEVGSGADMQRLREIIHVEDLASFQKAIERAHAGADARFDIRIVPSKGNVQHLLGAAHRVAQDAGAVIVGAIHDVTANKASEEALNRARAELAYVARVVTLSTLTASVAHQVNQPLAGIIANASACLRMLAADPPNIAGACETARRTIRDANRAAGVITHLRALFSRKEMALEPMDLNEAAKEVVALSLNELQRNRVIVQLDLAADLPPVAGDRIHLQQVLLTLLRNASDALTGVHDRPRLLVIRTEPEADDRVRVVVRDVGVGLDRHGVDRLFDPFFTTKSGSLGIGLSVGRSIIQKHRGRIWAEPNNGPGATFFISIPCALQPCCERGQT